MRQGRVESFTAKSALDPRTVHRNAEVEYWPIPWLRFANGTFLWYPSSDTPDEDRLMAKRAGFQTRRVGLYWTHSKRVARRLIAFADSKARHQLEPFQNPYDPYNPNCLPNDLLPKL